MKIYVQFYYNPEDRALGSDGVFFLDGRNKLSTLIKDAWDRMEKLRFVQPSYTGFKIMRGSLRSATEVYSSFGHYPNG